MDDIAEEVLDLNEEIRLKKQSVDNNRSLIKLNLLKIKGIRPE